MKIIFIAIMMMLIGLPCLSQEDSIWTGNLREVAIRPYSPDSVWGSDTFNVADFIFLENKLLLLVYERELRWKSQHEGKRTLYSGARCVLLNESGGVTAVSAEIPTEVEQFEGAFVEGIFIKARYCRLRVEVSSSEIALSEVENAVFLESIKPYVATMQDWLLISTFDEYYPAFQYSLFNTSNKEQKTLRHVQDKFCMELFRSEYKYLSPRQRMEVNQLAMDLKMDKKIIAAYARGFHTSSYFEKLYAPSFCTANGVTIFDHHCDSVFQFDRFGNALRAFSIDYHQQRQPNKWKKKVLHDDVTHTYFGLFNKESQFYLKEIKMDGSGLGEWKSLYYPYPENVLVHNGEVYYIYRPYESRQNRYLYKERLDK